ncbi:hippocampus abundant transcript-like protein 1 [Echinops telfairi]|uniref:Hippocampus abundant transcript-like protein 1 n=1 Tax=Echinops telfairi TaxID=9371 RepID=A0ABM0J3G2_ECHTE|nr:hippocampus abundant transcript-like protein 1 [Echinops telfairi]
MRKVLDHKVGVPKPLNESGTVKKVSKLKRKEKVTVRNLMDQLGSVSAGAPGRAASSAPAAGGSGIAGWRGTRLGPEFRVATGLRAYPLSRRLLIVGQHLRPADREVAGRGRVLASCLPGPGQSDAWSGLGSRVDELTAASGFRERTCQGWSRFRVCKFKTWSCHVVEEYIKKGAELPLQGLGQPSVYHAAIVIFLEFFAWGLLTTPMLTVVHETFPQHTFLMNGLVQGVKGLLSFLSAPLIGALSDIWGRKPFLIGTVFFTCFPIPLMRISPWWYFAMISVSGIFSVTFSVIFAYVADITREHERSTAYGWVSATFAASLVSSPAIGAYISANYGDSLVVLVATVVALLDICFILLAVPESLPEKIRPVSWGTKISWKQADPFASLKKVGKDSTVLLICITVFLSYLPEAGQYSSFFLYLRQVIGFGSIKIAAFIAMVGILSIVAQTVFLGILMRSLGNKNTVLLGLGFQMFQLAWYGIGSQAWMMWAAGTVAAMSSITFPAISALVSQNAESDQQGVSQGIITGIRGLCNGMGPALYGFIFYMFHVELTEMEPALNSNEVALQGAVIPGPPFLFGACIVLVSFVVALFIPEYSKTRGIHKRSHDSLTNTPERGINEDIEPLLQGSSVWELSSFKEPGNQCTEL